VRPVIRADSGPSGAAMQWQECFPMAARTSENETIGHPSRLALGTGGNGKRPSAEGACRLPSSRTSPLSRCRGKTAGLTVYSRTL
jgi:hypothetical protein